jgi:hypothetical protein
MSTYVVNCVYVSPSIQQSVIIDTLWWCCRVYDEEASSGADNSFVWPLCQPRIQRGNCHLLLPNSPRLEAAVLYQLAAFVPLDRFRRHAANHHLQRLEEYFKLGDITRTIYDCSGYTRMEWERQVPEREDFCCLGLTASTASRQGRDRQCRM